MSKKQSEISAIAEVKRPPSTLTLTGEVDSLKAQVLLDTGSTFNFISHDIAKLIASNNRKDLHKTMMLADGVKIDVKERIEF